MVFLEAYYMAEQNVCKCLASINSARLKPISGSVESLISQMRSVQGYTCRKAGTPLHYLPQHGVSVITGSPGTGKTTIINTIINILEESGLRTAILAPTGRAAKRITRDIRSLPSTIHRLLEYYFSESENMMRFGKTKEDQRTMMLSSSMKRR